MELSKEVSYALRHAPWEYGLKLDEEGFAPIGQLIDALNAKRSSSRQVSEANLQHMIETAEKARHEIRNDCIRAIYGHTTPERISCDTATPPDILYHGTNHKALPAILSEGLKPMERQYVHLSTDVETARRVGSRYDADPIVLQVDAARAAADGNPFYRGNDRVWLADVVAPCYLSEIR